MRTKITRPVWYSIEDDLDLIIASFQQQYGIRLSKDLDEMSGAEFCALLKSLGPDTPLGRIVSIRAETDSEVMREWGRSERRIYNEWRNKRATMVDKKTADDAIEAFKQAFLSMAQEKE